MQNIDYTLRVSKRARKTTLKIDHRGLTIVSPKSLSAAKIETLLQDHSAWIAKHQPLVNNKHREDLLADGRVVTLFGSEEQITYITDQSNLRKQGRVEESKAGLLVYSASDDHRNVLVDWLRKVAAQGLKARAAELSGLGNFSYKTISIRDQHTRWGSCSTSGQISLNWRLALAPIWIMDYVIIHELAHTKQMNHSDKFWAIVEEYCPKYKEARKWLRKEGYTLRSL